MTLRGVLPSPAQLDTSLRRGLWYLLIGFPVLVGLVALGNAVPALAEASVLTPVMGTMHGASCGAFREWRRHRGLWMLAVLFLLMILPAYVTLAFCPRADNERGLRVWPVLDLTAATIILGQTCRLLAAVAVLNWRAHRRPRACG